MIKTKKDFEYTTWHEFGHNAHHLMRYDEIMAWESVMQDDPGAVTWYVKHARKDNEKRGKREDFSESFMLFLGNPALLFTLSSKRYNFMFDFFTSRLKDEQIPSFKQRIGDQLMLTFSVWQKMDYSAEDIRRIYQSHELED